MKKLLVVVAALLIAGTAQAQQLNLGVSARRQYDRPVTDAVLMAPKIHNIIGYGQVSIPGLGQPEFTAALEVPVWDYKHLYLGLDNGFGFYPDADHNYGNGTWVTGLTSWIPVAHSFGAYAMFSATPTTSNSNTIQFGIYKQLR